MSQNELVKVDVDIVKYYQSCLKSFESVSDDEKYDIVIKTVASLNKNGIKVCFHGAICSITERFVSTYPTSEVVGSIFRSINTYLDGVIVGKNTSRLLEKVLLACKSEEVSQNELVRFQGQKFCDYMWIHYPDNLENNIGSHIVRLFFQFAFGVYIGMEGKVYSSKSVVMSTPMEDNYIEKLNDLVKRFLLNPQIDKLITNEYMSSTLQIILVICKVRCPEKFKEVVNHLMSVLCEIDDKISSEKANDIEIPLSFQDKYQSFFLECFILCLSNGRDWKRFIKKYLELGKDKFIAHILINSNCCGLFNSTVNRLNNPSLLLELVQQIKTSLYEISDFECGNIFLKLLIECVNKIPTIPATELAMLRSYKNSIIEIIQFLSRTPERSIDLFKFLNNGIKIEEDVDNDDENQDNNNVDEPTKICSLWSSLLMQAIIANFKPMPKTINKMFIALNSKNFVLLCSDAKASRVFDAFINSPNVTDDVKIKTFDSLTPEQLCEISCSKFGSRVMDSVFASGNNQLFILIQTKMESQRNQIKAHRIGKFIECKFFGYQSKQLGKEKLEKTENRKNKNIKRPLNVKSEKNSKKNKKQKV